MLLPLLLACAPDAAPTSARGPHTLTYALAWDDAGVTRTADGWETTTDQGFTVRVTGGYLASHRIQLGPCYTASLLPAAWACDETSNASAVEDTLLEPLRAPATVTFGEAATDGRYCSGEFVVAPAEVDTPDALELGMDGLTLSLSLEVAGAGGTWTALTATSTRNFRTYAGLYASDGDDTTVVDAGTGDFALTATRPLATLFDGVDLSTADGDAVGEAVVRNLVSTTRLTVSPGATE